MLYFIVKDDKRIDQSFRVIDTGSKVTFKCKSMGITKWYFKDISTQPLSYSTNLMIPGVNWQHEGDYYCFGSYRNKFKYFVAKTTLKVYSKLVHAIFF